MFVDSSISNVPIETLDHFANLMHLHRKVHDTRPHQQAGTAQTQAKLALRWYRDAARVINLARHFLLLVPPVGGQAVGSDG
ncbi:hypothetical protein, partial [Kocuria kalidii]|uniref:hypothetical protein n=1 Tax=Kocuria kalidii TaxID=3376283 RepID=UPI0037ABA532